MKKIIILITIFLMITALAYSHSFVMSLYVPLAGSRPSFHKNGILTDDLMENGEFAFEVGVIFQPSIYFTISKFHYIVLGVDFGWNRDTFKFITGTVNKAFTEFDDRMLCGYFCPPGINHFITINVNNHQR